MATYKVTLIVSDPAGGNDEYIMDSLCDHCGVEGWDLWDMRAEVTNDTTLPYNPPKEIEVEED